MASGSFGSPRTYLRLAPLVTSTLSLMYANDQHLFLGTLAGLSDGNDDAGNQEEQEQQQRHVVAVPGDFR